MTVRLTLAAAVLLAVQSALAVFRLPETEAMLKKTGGRFEFPNSQKGEIVVVNCAPAVNAAWLTEVVDYIKEETRFAVRLESGGQFALPKPKLVGDASVFVVDDPKLPPVLVAPEGRWTMMNVSGLKSEDATFHAMRVKKELARAFSFLCGGFVSQYPGAVVGPVANVSDLDKIVDYHYPIDVTDRFRPYMRPFGIRPTAVTTYLSACIHGKATPPTNDYQKAIWDQVHAMPKNPMKIQFDPKKGR